VRNKEKKKKRELVENRAYLESLSRKLLLVLPETSVFGQEQSLTTLTYFTSSFYESILDRMNLLSTIFRRSDLEFLSFAFIISDVISLSSFVYNGLRYTK